MNDFDKIIKEKLQNFSDIPSKEVYQKIKNNYPKKTLGEFILYNKFYFIAAVILIPFLFYLLKSSPSNNNSYKINSNNKEIYTQPINLSNSNDNTNNTQNAKEDKNFNIIQKNNHKNTSTKNILVKKTVFGFSDTIICGNEIEITYSGDINNLIIPKDIQYYLKENNKLCLNAIFSGDFIILYKNSKQDSIYTDTCTVKFNIIDPPKIELSSTNICEGEELDITILNYDNTILYNISTSDGNVQRINNNNYKISNFTTTGKKSILITTKDVNCINKVTKEIEIIPKPKLEYITAPNICSGNNGSLIIKSNNKQEIDNYILNNNIKSKNGVFSNLNAGIYTLKVKYNSTCILYDTILIRDSISILPYFISEKDLINPQKYYFRNYSKFEDKGYESNQNIKFLWKINNNAISDADNFEYEFLDKGKYTIELLAYLTDTDCSAVYSEDIFIDGSNFRIPNIFTPNGDGIGDEFKVKYEGNISKFSIMIMNRFGEVIWTSNDINKAWDGKINGNDDALEGLYYYIIKAEDSTGAKIEQNGALQLVRN